MSEDGILTARILTMWRMKEPHTDMCNVLIDIKPQGPFDPLGGLFTCHLPVIEADYAPGATLQFRMPIDEATGEWQHTTAFRLNNGPWIALGVCPVCGR